MSAHSNKSLMQPSKKNKPNGVGSTSTGKADKPKGKTLEIFTSKYDEETKKECYQPNEETLKFLETFGSNNIGFISIMGEQRKGKSTLMHVLFHGVEEAHHAPDTFVIGHTVESCTKNIHIWSIPIRKKDPATGEEWLFFLADSEGIGSVDSSDNRDAQIVASLISMSSGAIFNVLKSTIDETDIMKLSDNARKAQDLFRKGTKKDNQNGDGGEETKDKDGEESSPCPLVIQESWWVQRDWGNLPHKYTTDQEYFEAQINHQTKNEKASRARQILKKTFPNMKFIGVPDPRKDPHQDIKLVLKYRPEERNPKWNERMKEIYQSVRERIQPKRIHGKPLNGFVFAQFIRELIRGLNQGVIPNEEEQYVQLSDARCSSYYMMALNKFLTELAQRTSVQKSKSASTSSSDDSEDLLSLPPHLMEKSLYELVSRCEKFYREKCTGEVEEKVKLYFTQLQAKTKEEVNKCKQNYSSRVEIKIGGKLVEITKHFKELSEKDLELFEERLAERKEELFSLLTSSSKQDLEAVSRQLAKDATGSQKRVSRKEESMEDLEPYLHCQDDFSSEMIIRKVEEITKEIEDEYIKPYLHASSVPDKYKAVWCEQINQFIAGEVSTNWVEWMRLVSTNLEQKLQKEKDFVDAIQEHLQTCSFSIGGKELELKEQLERGQEEIEKLGEKLRAFEVEASKKEQERQIEMELFRSNLQTQLQHLTMERDDLAEDLDKKEQEIKQREDELKDGFNTLEIKYAIQEDTLKEKEEEVQKLETVNLALKQELGQLVIMKDQFEDLMLQKEQWVKNKLFFEEESSKLKADLRTEKEEYQRLFQEHQAQVCLIQEETDQKFKKVKEEAHLNKAKILKLQEDIKKTSQEKQKIANLLLEQNKKIEDLKSEKELFENKTNLVIQELNEKLQKRDEEAKSYREDIISKVQESEKTLLTQQNTLREKHKGEVEQLKKKLEESTREKSDLMTKLQVSLALQESKKKDLDENERKELAELRKDRVEERDRYLRLQLRFEAANKQIQTYTEELNKLKSDLYDSNSREKTLQREYQQAILNWSRNTRPSSQSSAPL